MVAVTATARRRLVLPVVVPFHQHPFCLSVILSPKLSAMPCVLERMRM